MTISENLNTIKKNLPAHVELVAVSKTKPEADIMAAYRAGQRIFGENKIQEMSRKRAGLPEDIQWHMIGHVQRNKVKQMAEYVALVHGVDSLRLLREIDKQARNFERTIACLLQVHIAEETTKFGFAPEEVMELLRSDLLDGFPNVHVKGLMGMATFTDDHGQVRREFSTLRQLFGRARELRPQMEVLSMGMSGDYRIAIEEGSTMVRLGSSIFGARDYSAP